MKLQIDIHATWENGHNGFHSACQGNAEVVALLLEHGKMDFNARDKSGQTGLMVAMERRKQDIVDLLLKDKRIDRV